MVFLLALLLGFGWFVLHRETVNEMYPALDKLASMPLANRWSSPEMMKIRQLGTAVVPPLRRVLREKDTRTTYLLLWVKTNWPWVARHYSHLPDPNKMTERRWTACQVLQTLGPAARPAVPELIEVMESKDPGDVNAGSMALWTVGIDADACERLAESLEQGKADFGRVSIVSALGSVRPPSTRTLNALTKALSDPSPYVQQRAAEALGSLGVATPAVIDGLKNLERASTNDLATITCCVALWQLQKDSATASSEVFKLLEPLLQHPIKQPFGAGSGGQGVGATEQVFMKGAELFQQLPLTDPDKTRALGILESFCDKSGRIFIRMLLLPAMMDLGMTREKCLDVCMTGLHQNEDYYRFQAARLLVAVAEKFPANDVAVNELLHDQDVGVRVYAAKVYWQNHKNPEVVVPVLADALNRAKYQSYYYPEIVRAALGELGEIGAEARAARGDVEALTKDPDPQIAQLAANTLIKLGK